MEKGKIKWYNETKGYGFITTENSDDIFVHRTGILDSGQSLQPEQEVSFETKETEKGTIAINVTQII